MIYLGEIVAVEFETTPECKWARDREWIGKDYWHINVHKNENE
jgi:hypothetical protein